MTLPYPPDAYVQAFIIVGLPLIALWLYFLPVFFARTQRGLIFALCLFTGWTLVGWIVSMVLAFADRRDVINAKAVF